MSRPRILIVSLGSIGRRHLATARALLPEAEIAVLRRPESAGGAAPPGVAQVFGDLAAAVAFKPAVAIVTCPAPDRVAVACALFDAGAHLLLEKPLAAAAAELAPLTARVFSDPRRVVRVGYNLRFKPLLQAARRLIQDGALGALRVARCEVGQYLPDWRPSADYRDTVSARAALGGGAVLELSHEIDLALWLFGAPDGVTARLDRVGDLEIDVEDCATLALDYAEPARSVVVQMDFLQRVARRRVLAVGSEATLEVDMIADAALLLRPGAPPEPVSPPSPSQGAADAYHRQLDAFLAEALAGYAPRFAPSAAGCAYAEAAAVLSVADAAKRASADGRRVALPRGRALERPA